MSELLNDSDKFKILRSVQGIVGTNIIFGEQRTTNDLVPYKTFNVYTAVTKEMEEDQVYFTSAHRQALINVWLKFLKDCEPSFVCLRTLPNVYTEKDFMTGNTWYKFRVRYYTNVEQDFEINKFLTLKELENFY